MSFVSPAEVTAHEGLDLTAASSRTLALAASPEGVGPGAEGEDRAIIEQKDKQDNEP